MATPPARTELADTYPNPSNGTFRTGIGKLFDYVTGLLGSSGNAADARAALGLVIGTDVVPKDGVLGTPTSGVLTNCTGTASGLTAGTANRVDSGLVTVASAMFPDIFGAAGNTINFTAGAPCVYFAAAPKAGMSRTLLISGDVTFTAGANLTIHGINSGNTIFLGAGAKCEVVAKTTTTFDMTYSYAGSFTITGTGFTSNPTGTATFVVENGVVNLTVPTLSGTSNSVSFTLSGIPVAIQSLITPINTMAFNAVDTDNTIAYAQLHAAQTYIGLFTVLNAAQIWTTGSTKTMMATTLTYRIN